MAMWRNVNPQQALRSGTRAAAPGEQGFTLIEVLVSLLILAVLAATAWKGVDSITTARQVADGNLKQTLRLQAVITQFEADMGEVMDTIAVPAFQFDGAHLRFTRRAPGGMQVVVWYTMQDRWLRWSSPVTTRIGELNKYWISTYILQGREPGTLVALKGVSQVQVYCFRGGALSNCQSTGDLVAARAAAAQKTAGTGSGAGGGQAGSGSGSGSGGGSGGGPQSTGSKSGGGAGTAPSTLIQREFVPGAVRCQVTMAEGSGFTGTVTKDVLIGPQMLEQ